MLKTKILGIVALLSLLLPVIGHSKITYQKAKATVWQDWTIPGYPHKIDLIYPKNWKARNSIAVIVLHGGGGSKHSIANFLGIKTSSVASYAASNAVNENYIDLNNVAFIFPQGQSKADAPNFFGWTNTLMNSSANDSMFLGALATALKRVDGFKKVFIIGHSMGGTMVNSLYCKLPERFDGFASLAGPQSKFQTGQNSACVPKVAKPHMHFAAMNDSIIGLAGNHSAITTKIDNKTYLMGRGGWVNNTSNNVIFLNELLITHQRASIRCGSTAKVTSGDVDSYCNGSIKIKKMAGTEHCSGNGSGCMNAVAGGGTSLIHQAVNFFKQF
jgi:poly(3-hydroxybutyrate) depolymerase